MAELFGQWIATTDGKAHYFLAPVGVALCGTQIERTTQPVCTDTHDGFQWHLPPCAECRSRNVQRWAKGGAA